MSKKLGKSEYPANHKPEDFSAFGPPATKDGQFTGTLICDCGCFNQAGVDSNKYYHASVVQSKKDSKYYAYFEWGRVGAKIVDFQFIECSSKEEAQREYEAKLHEKNTKRGEWINHATLGKILQAKAGKDCYLVRPQATRATGLPDARTIKFNEGVAKPVAPKTSTKKISIDSYTQKLMRDLNVATVSYTRGAMTDDSMPTVEAINEARNILTAAMTRLKSIGDNVDDQVKDVELVNLTRFMYGRIPKKKERNAEASTWILSKNNIVLWQQDLDAFESALSTGTDEVEIENDPFSGMPIEMEWLDPKSKVGEFVYNWAPKATRKRHQYGNMKILNIWTINRLEEGKRFENGQKIIQKGMKNIYEKPLHQPIGRIDVSKEFESLYQNTNTALLFHGSRSVNCSGLLREGFRFPKELVGVSIAGAMFSGGAGGIYTADDWMKSAGYTSLQSSYWSNGGGAIKGRGAFMFACDVALGVPHVAPHSYPYVSYPNGSHSIMGKAGVSGVQNNEYIILKKDQYKFRYLIEFAT